jgi:hypothetical protein
MFVDDDCYAEVYIVERVEQAITASIEAIFIVLGDSDLLSRQDPISWDKLFEMAISHFNKILGLDIDTRQLDIGPPEAFLERTISKLRAFHDHRKAFTVSEMTELVGLLSYIASSSRWLRHLLSHLYTSITAALKINQAHLISSSTKFKAAIKAIRASDTITSQAPPTEVQRFTQSWVARTVHRAQHRHYLNTTAKAELKIILTVLSDPTAAQLLTWSTELKIAKPMVTVAWMLQGVSPSHAASGGITNGAPTFGPLPSSSCAPTEMGN